MSSKQLTCVLLIGLMVCLSFCASNQNSNTRSKNNIEQSGTSHPVELKYNPNLNTQLVKSINILPDANCSLNLREVISLFKKNDTNNVKQLPVDVIQTEIDCYWTQILLVNLSHNYQSKILYFPKGWKSLSCYTVLQDSILDQRYIGIDYKIEVLPVRVSPNDSVQVYVQYPPKSNAYFPLLNVHELAELEYQNYHSRITIKFFLIGALTFYFLFFVAQFIFQKDRLNLYYLMFLLGATGYLFTMVETIPFFEYCPKIFTNIRNLQYLFLSSTVLTILGLVNYLHYFLKIRIVNMKLMIIGNLLMGVLVLVAIVPLFFSYLLELKHYSQYLQYFRIIALLNFVYILFLCTWAMIVKLKLGLVIFLSFLPFILSCIWYATSYIFLGGFNYLSIESILLISGFLITLLLFGVLLGIRNYLVRMDNIKLEQRAAFLKELHEFKSQFFTNFTHEFRTPLTVIKGMASQLKNQNYSRDLILKNSDRLLVLVNQLLDLSKMENKTVKVNWVNGDIIPYLKYLTESCHSLAHIEQINLAFFSREDSIIMDFDEMKLERILINLISNAIKFTPEYGNVKVITGKKLRNKQSYLEIVVHDTGRGIPSDQIQRIFDRFYQVSEMSSSLPEDKRETTSTYEGYGIGLALVKELIDLLSGFIEVQSTPEEGAEFRVYLPILNESTVAVFRNKESHIKTELFETSSEVPEGSNSIIKDKPIVLVIEDNLDVVQYIFTCLKSSYQHVRASNGKLGIQKALDTIPDVIICDIMMPEMNGFEVCKNLKEDPRTSHIPIILLTAKATQEDRIKGLSLGADAYLIKPFNKEELLIRISQLVQQRQRLIEKFSSIQSSILSLNTKETIEADFLKKLLQIIHKNLGDEQFNTHYLCREIAMSRTQLYRKLKAITGKSTGQFIREYKLDQAKSLLETTDLSIGEIASLVGYKDFSHFSRSYMQEYGIRPSESRS